MSPECSHWSWTPHQNAPGADVLRGHPDEYPETVLKFKLITSPIPIGCCQSVHSSLKLLLTCSQTSCVQNKILQALPAAPVPGGIMQTAGHKIWAYALLASKSGYLATVF